MAVEGVAIPGILTTGARSPVGPPVWESIDVDQLEDRVDASGMDRLANTAYWTNLSSYFGHGGKLLFYHGVSDPWFSANDTVNYYERMAADSGGMEMVRETSSRAFLVPGMGQRNARSFRSPQRGRELGGRRQGPRCGGRDGARLSRPLSAALRLSATCAVQGPRRPGERSEF